MAILDYMNFMLTSQFYLFKKFDTSTCIAVIDESSVSSTQLEADWNTFRNVWANRPYYLLQAEELANGSLLNIPANLQDDITNDPLTTAYLVANGQEVPRDNGDPLLAADWFALINGSSLSSGDSVFIFIDDSGSLTIAEVQASYDLFKSNCNAAGVLVYEVYDSVENYIAPFITWSGTPA